MGIKRTDLWENKWKSSPFEKKGNENKAKGKNKAQREGNLLMGIFS